MIREPLLAAKFDTDNSANMRTVLANLPLLASTKLDGVRCIVMGGVAYSRSMKKIPNAYIQHTLGTMRAAEGLDGELIIGSPTDPLCYNTTVSAVMRKSGEPDFKFYVFDCIKQDVIDYDFEDRIRSIESSRLIVRLDQKRCNTWDEILKVEDAALTEGYEGLILRSPFGYYKQGRSTLKESIAVKLKRFLDSEAEVIAITELQHNLNAREVNEVGRTKRSTHQAGKSGGDTMGSLYVRDLTSGVEFEIGTGFTAEMRQEWWNYRLKRLGLIVKYKFFPVGVKDKPRHPVYLGVRDERDM